jgi:hypothetical protein
MTCDVVTLVELLKLVIEYEPSLIAYCLVSCTYVRCSCTVGVRVSCFLQGETADSRQHGEPLLAAACDHVIRLTVAAE